MGRPSNTDERRAQIAEGLLSVMAKHGYDGATIQRIAVKKLPMKWLMARKASFSMRRRTVFMHRRQSWNF